MLETLNSYVQVASSRGRTFGPQTGGLLDPRFPVILIVSVFGHGVFFTLLILLSWWSPKTPHLRPRLAAEDKVTLIDVGPSSLRLPPEPPEHVDTSHLAVDPHMDDTHLIARSPNPGFSHGTGKNQLPTGTTNRAGGGSQDVGNATATPNSSNKEIRPPNADPVQINRPVQSDRAIAPGIAAAKPAPPPPPPAQAQKDSSGNAPGTKAEDSGAARQLGYRAIESQYRSYVRAKIYKTNERIMPRQYIEGVLSREVSAEFAVSLDRGGRLRSVRLIRSCGFSPLDDVARQAIYLAGPFEGFPLEATDPMDIDVTVHYTPFK